MANQNFYLFPIVLGLYYLGVWLLAGRAPSRKSIVVRYEPPAGLSPAALRYLWIMGTDTRSFTAILAQLASRKFLSFVPDPERRVLLLKRLLPEEHSLAALTQEERLVFKKIFKWDETVEVREPGWELLEKLEETIENQVKQKYFTRHRGYVLFGLLLSAAATVWMGYSLALFGTDKFDAAVANYFGAMVVFVLGLMGVNLWEKNLQAVKLAIRGLYRRRALPLLLVLAFIYPAIWYLILKDTAPVYGNVTMLMVLVSTFASPLLRNYTTTGRQVFEETLGFRQFLIAAEQDQLNRLNPPTQAMQAGEKYLPYAIALDVRELWGDRLSSSAMVETSL